MLIQPKHIKDKGGEEKIKGRIELDKDNEEKGSQSVIHKYKRN